MQGYGLTECCAGANIALADNYEQFATNGPPLPCIEMCFESVPGELWARAFVGGGCGRVHVCACRQRAAAAVHQDVLRERAG